MFRQVPACYSAWGCVAVWASVPAVLTKSCFGCPLRGDIRWQGDIYICTYKCLGGFQEEEQPLTSNSPKGTTFPQASQPRATPFLTVDVVSSVSIGHFGRNLAESAKLADTHGFDRTLFVHA